MPRPAHPHIEPCARCGNAPDPALLPRWEQTFWCELLGVDAGAVTAADLSDRLRPSRARRPALRRQVGGPTEA